MRGTPDMTDEDADRPAAAAGKYRGALPTAIMKEAPASANTDVADT